MSDAQLVGTVERVTFRNEESGWSVLRLLPDGERQSVAVVGVLPAVLEGERMRLWGAFAEHPRYGRQFRVQAAEAERPSTVAGVERYLASGLVKGVGERTAQRLVAMFGERTLKVIEEDPSALQGIRGIGPERARRIHESVMSQRGIQAVMVFLKEHQVPTGLAVRIYRQYGAACLDILRQDPYRLADEVQGIGFKRADRIALDLGLDPLAPERLRAAALYALSQAAAEGHVYLPDEAVAERLASLVGMPVDAAQSLEAVQALLAQGRIVRGTGDLEGALYLPQLADDEAAVARWVVRRLADAPRSATAAAADPELSDEQAQAVRLALERRLIIITGGPGTGKTTVVRALIAALRGSAPVALAAPTGRAAKRLSEVTGHPAQTLHRLLGYGQGEGFGPTREELRVERVIVDEVSMVDLHLFRELVEVIPPGAFLTLVGDQDQLPSVGPGQVLRDLLEAGVPHVRLERIYRQSSRSGIVENAHRIHAGRPVVARPDFWWIREEDVERVADRIVQLVTRDLPAEGFDPWEAVQVLSPGHRAEAGVERLNERLQAILNPPRPDLPEVAHRGRVLRVGDKVLQLRNNYPKQVLNGDTGRIRAIDPRDRTVEAVFTDAQGSHAVRYAEGELDELGLAYAMSVHKAQGSEYPVVLVPVVTAHYMLLQRSLLYTAVTRAKERVILLGSPRAVAIALEQAEGGRRYSGLEARIRALAGG